MVVLSAWALTFTTSLAVLRTKESLVMAHQRNPICVCYAAKAYPAFCMCSPSVPT